MALRILLLLIPNNQVKAVVMIMEVQTILQHQLIQLKQILHQLIQLKQILHNQAQIVLQQNQVHKIQVITHQVKIVMRHQVIKIINH